MRKLLLALTAFLCFLNTNAQEDSVDISYVSDDVVLKDFDLPIVRPYRGGAVIIPTFEGSWSNDMKGAFEYACRIMEEAMPSTFPIHITAVMDDTNPKYLDKNVLSSVIRYSTLNTEEDHYFYPPFSSESTWIQMKATKYGEYAGPYTTAIFDSLLTIESFSEPDALIRYYNYGNKITKNCSFSLKGEPNSKYYDFVTVVLRDLAKAFGFSWRYSTVKSGRIAYNTKRLLPYEKNIINALNSTAGSLNLDDVTRGEVNLQLSRLTFHFYAPTTWDKERSLNYFIPDSNLKITQLLSYDFGRGSVIRDINDSQLEDVFTDLLYWKGDIAVGDPVVHDRSSMGGSQGTIAYHSDIDLSISSPRNVTAESGSTLQSAYDESQRSELDTYLQRFFPEKQAPNAWHVSLLKKDGTWDLVYLGSDSRLSINTSKFELHCNTEEYARTCDGYLRCCIQYWAFATRQDDNGLRFNKTYLLDYLPQKVSMKYVKMLPSSSITLPLSAASTAGFQTDVKIAINHIEGAERIVVSQWDDGDEVPYMYDVDDLRDGYFTATVDKDYPTTFQITAYNKNGRTVSDKYELKALGGRLPSNPFVIVDGKIQFNAPSRNGNSESSSIVSADIRRIDNAGNSTIRPSVDGNTISLSGLTHGAYMLSVTDTQGKQYSFKFSY